MIVYEAVPGLSDDDAFLQQSITLVLCRCKPPRSDSRHFRLHARARPHSSCNRDAPIQFTHARTHTCTHVHALTHFIDAVELLGRRYKW